MSTPAMKILITGSSSGMGRWLAARYCEAGHDVWGVARRDQADFQKSLQTFSVYLMSSILGYGPQIVNKLGITMRFMTNVQRKR